MKVERDRQRPRPRGGRERVLETAYGLFKHHGLQAVGVDRIVAEASVAKTTLYRHFPSKDDLAVAVLEHHSDVWTHGWLEAQIKKRATTPAGRILALFDAFNEWFHSDGYRGCLLLNSLQETRDPASPVRAAAQAALSDIRTLIRDLGRAAGAGDPERLAFEIQTLLMGSVVAAVNGDTNAAARMRPIARRLLEQENIAA